MSNTTHDISLENKQQKDINITGLYSITSVNESDRLSFAKQILAGLTILCISTFIAYAMFPDNKALISIFELIKIGALPLITLVITFYFPNNSIK